ncbi:hypothetical protein ABW19_dt0204471 [Dactylella cylindrospora]|nr:hypothetical protein ABW19_dt0204471 [Dactylella cylindrospora]
MAGKSAEDLDASDVDTLKTQIDSIRACHQQSQCAFDSGAGNPLEIIKASRELLKDLEELELDVLEYENLFYPYHRLAADILQLYGQSCLQDALQSTDQTETVSINYKSLKSAQKAFNKVIYLFDCMCNSDIPIDRKDRIDIELLRLEAELCKSAADFYIIEGTKDSERPAPESNINARRRQAFNSLSAIQRHSEKLSRLYSNDTTLPSSLRSDLGKRLEQIRNAVNDILPQGRT